MDKNEIAQKPKVYIRKPNSCRDKIFLEGVKRLMSVWDTCGSNRLNKLAEIFEEMGKDATFNRFECNFFADVFKSAKNGFIEKYNSFAINLDYNDNLYFWIMLLDAETRYKLAGEIWPLMNRPGLVLDLFISSGFANLKDLIKAFKSGMRANKENIELFKNILCNEYSKADSNKRALMQDSVRDIVSCIEDSSYKKNTQCVFGLYRNFELPYRPDIKKANFINQRAQIINEDTMAIMNYLKGRYQGK